MKSRFEYWAATLTAIATVSCGSNPQSPGNKGTRTNLPRLAALPGDALLRRAAERYSTAVCYEDNGTASLIPPVQAKDKACEFHFWTSFKRDEYLKFSFRSGCEERSGFEYAKGVAKIWSEVGGQRRDTEDRAEDALIGAIEKVAGTSSGISRVVPNLLVGRDAFRLKAAATHVLEAKIVGCGFDECYEVLVQEAPSTRVRYTLDRDFIVRAREDRHASPDGEWGTSITISSSCVAGH